MIDTDIVHCTLYIHCCIYQIIHKFLSQLSYTMIQHAADYHQSKTTSTYRSTRLSESRTTWRCLFTSPVAIILLFLLSWNQPFRHVHYHTNAFVVNQRTSSSQDRSTSTSTYQSMDSRSAARLNVVDDDDDDDNAFDIDNDDNNEDIMNYDFESMPLRSSTQDNNRVNQPKSRMTDYITQYLERNPVVSDDGSDTSLQTIANAMALRDIKDATHLIAIPMEQSHELLLELESVQRAILHHCPILLDACIPPASTRLPLLYVQATNKAKDEISMARTTTTISKIVQRLVTKHFFRKPIH